MDEGETEKSEKRREASSGKKRKRANKLKLLSKKRKVNVSQVSTMCIYTYMDTIHYTT